MPRRIDLMNMGIVGVAAVLFGSLAGCEDYRTRTDAIGMDLGDAVAHNVAVQTIDPAPPASKNQRIAIDGDPALLAAQRYKAGTVKQPQGLSSQDISVTQSSGPTGTQ